MATTAFKEFIQKRMGDQLSLRDLAKKSGMSHAALSKLLAYDKDVQPDLETIVKIAKALEVDPMQLVELTVSDSGGRSELDARAALMALEYSKLPPEMQQVIDDLLITMRNRRSASQGG